MSFIKQLTLLNNLVVEATYEYKTRSIHICEKVGHEHDNLSSIVLTNKNFIENRLQLHGNVKYFVIYSNKGINIQLIPSEKAFSIYFDNNFYTFQYKQLFLLIVLHFHPYSIDS